MADVLASNLDTVSTTRYREVVLTVSKSDAIATDDNHILTLLILTSAKFLGASIIKLTKEARPVKHIVRLIVALFAFSTGVGLDRLLSWQPKGVEKAPPIVSYEPISFVAAEPVLPTPVSTPKPILIFDYDQEKFWPEASYAIIGKRPKGFSKDDYFYIQILQGDHTDEYVLFSIYDERGNTDLRASFALVTEQRLFFVTQPSADGFVYRFDGEFLRHGELYDAPEGEPVVKGTLTKSRDNRTVAEWPMKFEIEHDGC